MKTKFQIMIIVGIFVLIGGIIMLNQTTQIFGLNPNIKEGVVSASGELSASNLRDLGYSGMEIVSYKVNNNVFAEKDYSTVSYDFNSTISKSPTQKYTNGLSVSQEIYINNKLETKQSFNMSILIQIDYDKITWNGTVFYLKDYPIEKPLKLESWADEETGKLIVPNIFFDDIYNKRISYKDVAEQGGYALVYQDGKLNYIELVVKNKEINAFEDSKVDPTYYNQTDGFAVLVPTRNTIYGIAMNNSDIWYVNQYNDNLYHVTKNGVNLTGSFSLSSIGAGDVVGMAFNGSDFWFADVSDEVIYHTDYLGNNQTNAFEGGGGNFPYDVELNISVGRPDTFTVLEVTTKTIHFHNNSGYEYAHIHYDTIGSDNARAFFWNNSDFWINDINDDFVYHTNRTGGNITDGFSTSAFGSNNPYGITTNVTTGTPTDFWITDATDDFVYHLSTNAPPAGDTCTYTSGNWVMDCSDYCNITGNVNATNGGIFSMIGTGVTTFDANVSNFSLYHISGGCNVSCREGCIKYG